MSYDPAEPTAKDQVRGLIGDTGTPEFLADATIDAVLTRQSNVFYAAAECADRIGALMRRRPESMTVGTATVTRGQRPTDWSALAQSLRQRAVTESGSAVPYAGGLTTSDKQARDADTDLVDPFFTRRTGDNPGDAVDDRGWCP